jgi:hypothetical protein
MTAKRKDGQMATGKKARDIFTKTTKTPDIGQDVPPRVKGRPRTVEPYQKVTVCLFDRHTLWLDKLGLAIREKTGKHVARAELIRAIVDHAAVWIRPNGKPEDFDKAVRSLLKDI